jgi:DNA-binding transcriptional regulator YiaG
MKSASHHYIESGLRNVWLANGFRRHATPYGSGVSIRDVDGLHKVIGGAIARRPGLTGSQIRFLRKELELSQKALAALLGTSEQTVSLWERRGRMPQASDRLLRLLYLERTEGNVKVQALIDRLIDSERNAREPLTFRARRGDWKEAA